MKMTTVILLGFFSILMFTYKGYRAMDVHMNEDITGIHGSTNKDMRCSFIPEGDDFVQMVGIKRRGKLSNSGYRIATFYNPTRAKQSHLTEKGQYLKGRITLFNSSEPFTTVTMRFSEIRCEDEDNYTCEVIFDSGGINYINTSKSSSITVNSNPDIPDAILPSVQLSKVQDGQNVTFICNGNLGKPTPGKLIWRKQKDGKVLNTYYNVSTEVEEIPENCTFHGTSNLTLQITTNDTGAVIECTEETFEYNKSMWLQTQEINVNYKFKSMFITMDPCGDRYTEGSINQINMTCHAEGIPMPVFRWYKESSIDITLESDSMLRLLHPSISISGVYVCTASQHIGGHIYNESTSINLTIVPSNSTLILNQDSKMNPILYAVVAVIVVIVIITVVAVLRYVCCKKERRRSINKIVNEESEHETETVKKQVQVTLSSDYGTVHDATDKPLSSSISLLKTEGSQYCEVDLTVGKLSKPGNTTNRNLFNNEMSTDQIKVVKSPASSAIYASVNKRPTSDNTSDTRSPDSGHMTNRDSNHTQDSAQVSQKNKNALDPTKQVRAKNQSSSSNGDQSVPTILSPVEKVSSV